MTLKILAGSLKGRTIKIPKTASTRPITSLLRKSIFDTCQFFIENARVLDLFAGSGAIGIEALSRGACFACFIDNGQIAIECIKENIKTLQLSHRSLILKKDAFIFLEDFDKDPFDILFIDPPYPIGQEGYEKLVTLLAKSKVLHQESKLFLETPSPIAASLAPIITSQFVIRKEKKSSTTTLFQLLIKS
jgi:16S rRNA (guanine966-N2)-methyltransferase